MILNICVNAVHAIDKKEGNIFISIKDNGCGMDKDTLRQIFDPFFTTKKGGEGTGLGLALAEQIITSHKGYIFAESEPGKGSTFYIGIPVLDAGQARESVTVSEKREMRMIFADDNAKVLELLRRNFEKLGISIDSISRETVEAKNKGIIHGYIEKPMSDRSVLEAIRECRKEMGA